MFKKYIKLLLIYSLTKITNCYFNILPNKIKCLNLNLKNDDRLNYYQTSYLFKSRLKEPKSYINKINRNYCLPKDLFGIRIIYDTPKLYDNHCIAYYILENIERNFNTISNTYDDYIANPKDNGYIGLHINLSLSIYNLLNYQIEIQIRSKEMDYYNDYGKPSEYYYNKKKLKIT